MDRACVGSWVFSGQKCRYKATFIVRMGTRESDEQPTCAMHLGRTVTAFWYAGDRGASQVTVTPIKEGQ